MKRGKPSKPKKAALRKTNLQRRSRAPKAERAKPVRKAKADRFAQLPPSLDIKKVGRPSKYDPSFCDLVLELGAQGKSKTQIAALIGVSRQTLDNWAKEHEEFLDAIKGARDLALAWWETVGQTNMTRQGFNATAYIFQMKNRFREDYRDVNVSEHTGRDGAPLMPKSGSRDVARAVLDILRGAQIEGAAQSTDEGDEIDEPNEELV